MSDNNQLRWGIHSGTIMSRDTGNPIPCNSIDEAKKKTTELELEFKQRGYALWFANWYDSEGKRHVVHGGNFCAS